MEITTGNLGEFKFVLRIKEISAHTKSIIRTKQKKKNRKTAFEDTMA